MKQAPALFVSHGSPMFALEPGTLGPRLRAVGEALDTLAAILVVSAHWITPHVQVMTTARPETVHDFFGFPEALYNITYPAAGEPTLAQETAEVLAAAGFDITLDDTRGLDHGAWVPLRHLFPNADVPAFQVSLPNDADTAGALRLGEALAPLRNRGVLIVGSGSLTHNLREFRHKPVSTEYVRAFSDWVRTAVLARDTAALVDYRRRAPEAPRAHPTEEHFLPLLVAAGAAAKADDVTVLEGGIVEDILCMDSFAYGLGG